MSVLRFHSANGELCELRLSESVLAESIKSQLESVDDVWCKIDGLDFDATMSDVEGLDKQPLFFEWQNIEWNFEVLASAVKMPLALFVNDVLDPNVRFSLWHDKARLSGPVKLGNYVGRTRFSVRDQRGKCFFELGVEVFPQKLDYKNDFPVMISEITEIVYSLAFDVFTKTFAATKPRATYNQTHAEWLNLFKVLAESFEQSVETILRNPKSCLVETNRIKPVERVRRVNYKSVLKALRKPEKYCRGDGYEIAPGFNVSHLAEGKKRLSYDTHENRFVKWALSDLVKRITHLMSEINDKDLGRMDQSKVLEGELAFLRACNGRLKSRLMSPIFSNVSSFENQQQFSTTLTMAPGYKEFYHRYLLLRKGLTMADNDLFSMDYKDIATLYEYWCFLKTVKILKENPKYDLTDTDVVKIQHNRFSVNLAKGRKSEVNFKVKTTGDEISLFYNREFPAKDYTHTFKQVPDNFIEFSRTGYETSKDKKTFKVMLDAKYRFDKGSRQYPTSAIQNGPPLDSIAQLHRYRDAILWQQNSQDSVPIANKGLGGVILFPYPNEEQMFRQHPFFKSINEVNIGAIPLRPGEKNNVLYREYLDSLFEQSGESLHEKQIRQDTRLYDKKRQSQRDLVMVGLVPSKNRSARLKYHEDCGYFYTQWAKDPKFPLERVSAIALYDQKLKEIYALAEVESLEFLLGSELKTTGTTWAARAQSKKHCVYKLNKLTKVQLVAGKQMAGNRSGRFFVSRLGLDLAIEHNEPDLLFMNSWNSYLEWKRLKTNYKNVRVSRVSKSDKHGNDVSDLTFNCEEIGK